MWATVFSFPLHCLLSYLEFRLSSSRGISARKQAQSISELGPRGVHSKSINYLKIILLPQSFSSSLTRFAKNGGNVSNSFSLHRHPSYVEFTCIFDTRIIIHFFCILSNLATCIILDWKIWLHAGHVSEIFFNKNFLVPFLTGLTEK